MRFYRFIYAAALGLLALTATAHADTWRFGLEEIEGSVQYSYAERFKELVEQKSGGDITVQLLPYGKWGSAYSALYDAIQGGAIQLGFGSGALGGTVPESQLLNLNYIMPSDQWITAQGLNSDTFLKSQAWQQAFRKRSLVPLAELPEGYQVWTANKPIHSPADMANLKIRVMDNSLLRQTYQAYGASPTSIAYGELYSALQQGQAEGNIQPVFAHQEMAFYEVQKDMIFAQQSQFVATMMGNADWYDGLSAKQQAIIDDVTRSLVREGYDIQTRYNKDRLAIIKKKSDINIIRLSDPQQARFRKLAKPVRQVYVKEVGPLGQQSLDALLKAFRQAAPQADS
ncbi:MAG: TRAP transporter substrate-binding protein DctP [Alcanivorax sp.]|nr:TRAP transporter substrate-binding protein DctP [Alcanivorax sp.]